MGEIAAVISDLEWKAETLKSCLRLRRAYGSERKAETGKGVVRKAETLKS
jgi:hypothetical protein